LTESRACYEYEYSIAERCRKGSVEFLPRPDKESELDVWRRLLLRTICEAIGRTERDLVFDTPYGLFGDASVRDHHILERVAYLRLTIKAVPDFVYNLDDYSFFRRVDS
jgi:hypothetical protein